MSSSSLRMESLLSIRSKHEQEITQVNYMYYKRFYHILKINPFKKHKTKVGFTVSQEVDRLAGLPSLSWVSSFLMSSVSLAMVSSMTSSCWFSCPYIWLLSLICCSLSTISAYSFLYKQKGQTRVTSMKDECPNQQFSFLIFTNSL